MWEGNSKVNRYDSQKWDRRSVKVWGGELVGSRVELQKAEFQNQKLNEDNFDDEETFVFASPLAERLLQR